MRAKQFLPEATTIGVLPKRPARTGSRPSRGHEAQPRYKTNGVQEVSLGKVLPWPEVVNKINSAMKATGWKGKRQSDDAFMFSTKGQETDDQWYFVIIESEGDNFFSYALGTVEDGDPHIDDAFKGKLPNTEASVSELLNTIRDGFGLDEQKVAEHKKGVKAVIYNKKPKPVAGPEAFKANQKKRSEAKKKPSAPKAPQKVDAHLGEEQFCSECGGSLAEHGKASRALCISSKPDSQLGASMLSSCKSQGFRARDGNKSHKLGKGPESRVKVGGHKIKGHKYGGPLPDWS